MSHVAINIYVYDTKIGKFNIINSEIAFIDKNEIWEDFVRFMEIEDTSNKFFIIRTESVDGYDATFHTVRTDMDGNAIETTEINPNTIDKDILIDAIIGNKIPDITAKHADKFLKKCIKLSGSGFIWASDAKQRLSKMNVLRLKEIYQKLKRANR